MKKRTLLVRPKLGREFVIARAVALFQHPLFIFLTFAGNGLALLSAGGFYYLERGQNPNLITFLDAMWWSLQTVTTVGYGDISPVTPWGKVIGMGLMLFGTALFSAFTALFAAILLEPEITEVEEEVRELEETLRNT